jgi:hypothetical protein
VADAAKAVWSPGHPFCGLWSLIGARATVTGVIFSNRFASRHGVVA